MYDCSVEFNWNSKQTIQRLATELLNYLLTESLDSFLIPSLIPTHSTSFNLFPNLALKTYLFSMSSNYFFF